MSKYTPGHWIKRGTEVYRHYVASNGVVIHHHIASARKSTYVDRKYIKHPAAQVEANARLIAAAPKDVGPT